MKYCMLFFLCLVSSFAFSQTRFAVDFTSSRKEAGTNVSIEFDVSSESQSSIVLSYEWNFGDGEIFVGSKTASHKYIDAGDYSVTLTTKDMHGNVATATHRVQILKNAPPIADFYFKRQDIAVGEEIPFTSLSKDEDGEIKTYEWSIDTSPTLTGIGIRWMQKVEKPGKYRITHRVVDNLGGEAVLQKDLFVLPINIEPELDISFPTEIPINEFVKFQVKAKDPDGKIVKATWSLDDMPEEEFDAKDFGINVKYEHMVLLKVKIVDDRGAETIRYGKMFAKDSSNVPAVILRSSSEKTLPKKSVGFQATLKGKFSNLKQVKWSFGDGSPDKISGLEAEHEFSGPGKYIVKAEFEFAKGNLASKTTEIEVLPGAPSRTVPTQVVLNEREYIELAPTQKLLVNFSAYNGTSSFTPMSTPDWNYSSSVVNVTRVTGGAWIEGIAGDTTLSVSIDGVTSQTIAVKVVGFSNSVSVTKKGNFFGSSNGTYCTFINQTTGSYTVSTNTLDAAYALSNGGTSGDKLRLCDDFEIPVKDSSVSFIVNNSSGIPTYSYLKSNIRLMSGRGGFLYFPKTSQLKFNYSDNRFINWDHDFSLTYWSLQSISSAYRVAPYILGKRLLVGSPDNLAIRINGNSNWVEVHGPDPYKTSEFTNRWVHFGVTFNAGSGILKYYIDGNLIQSISVPSDDIFGDSSLSMAGVAGSALDELRFWGKELNSSEVSADLFSQPDLSSSDLLASFSFDNGSEFYLPSDNGAGWSAYSLESDGGFIPQLRSQPIGVIDTVANSSTKAELTAEIPKAELGNQKVSIRILPGLFGGIERIYLQVSPCFSTCQQAVYLESLTSKRFSPYFYLGALKSAQSSMIVTIPFNSQGVSRSDLQFLKVAHLDLNGTFEVLEPKEVNSQEGYLTFATYFGGTFWITIPTNYSSGIPIFTNADLHQAIATSLGRRELYAHVSAAQSSYVAITPSFVTTLNSTYCSGIATISFAASFGGTSFTMGNLQTGRNVCFVYYSLFAGTDWSTLTGKNYFYIDEFILDKD